MIRKSFSLILFILMSQLVLAGVHRVGTYNIRTTGMSADSLERAWDKRKESVVKMIRDTMSFDVVVMQEVSNKQHTYINEQLGDVYAYYDGPSTGNEILYRKSKYTCLDKGYYYLAPDPTKSGAAWDAQQTRYGCWVKLQDKTSKEIFYFCGTHLDLYPISIREGARVNVEQMLKIAGNYPCLITGDMNSEPADHDPLSNYEQSFGNARQICKTEPQGSYYTFASGMDPAKASKLLDYLFVRNMEVESYFVNNSTLGRTLMPSDHMPLMCEVTLLSPLRATTHVVSDVAELRQAAKDAQANDLIYLNPGVYDLGNEPLTMMNTCVLEGEEGTIITGTNQLIQGDQYVSLELRGLTFENATAPYDVYGSLVGLNGKYLTISDCHFIKNSTLSFSWIYVKDCELNIDHCLFRGNQAPNQNGGIYITATVGTDRYPLTMTNCLFINNSSFDTPVLYFNSEATAYIYGNAFISNEANRKGAIFLDALDNKKDIRLVNNTFANNKIDRSSSLMDALLGGSAIWQNVSANGYLTMMNNTIVGNHTACWRGEGVPSTKFVGGAVQLQSGKVRLYNNIIAGNYSSTAGRGDISVTNTVPSIVGGYNVFSSADNMNYTATAQDWVAANYATACTELVTLLGGEAKDNHYYPTIFAYGEAQDIYALSPLTNLYAGQDIAVLDETAMSASTISSDILNLGSKTGTLTLDQSAALRNDYTVPGSMEQGIQPTDLDEVNDQSPIHNQKSKIWKNGHIYIINNNQYYDLLGFPSIP